MCDRIVLFSLTLMAGGLRLLVQLVAVILVMFSRVRVSLPQRMNAIVSIVFPSSLHQQILSSSHLGCDGYHSFISLMHSLYDDMLTTDGSVVFWK